MDYSEEQIRDYLLGKLPAEETKALEKEMKADSELTEAIALQRDVMMGIRAAFDDQLRKKLNQVDAESSDNIRILSPKILWQWAGAAAIVLGTLGVYFYMNQTSLDQRLYYTYYEDFPNIIEPAQRDEPGGSAAFTAYQAKDWEKAREEFEKLTVTQPAEVYPYFYQGLVLMNLEDWHAAITALERVRGSNDDRFLAPATWYVALAYLRNNNYDRAKLILESIADAPGSYREDARKILEDLY